MDTITITDASISDAEEILALQKLAYKSEAGLYDDYSIPPLTQTLEDLIDQFSSNIILKAVSDGEIVGSVRGYVQDGTGYIGRLTVNPDLQNRGIGTRLMREIEARLAPVQRYELFTGEGSVRNLYLYQKLGYQIVRHEFLSDKVTIVYLEKPAR